MSRLSVRPPTAKRTQRFLSFLKRASILSIRLMKYSETKPQNTPSSITYGMREA